MIVDGYSLTDESTEMVQISKMRHAKLMTWRFEKTNTGVMVKAHLDAIIAETMNLGYDHLTLVQFKEHLDMITQPMHGSRSIDSLALSIGGKSGVPRWQVRCFAGY